VEAVLADGAGLAAGAAVRAGTRRLEIRFAAPSFAAPDRIRFRYRLEPYETRWSEGGQKRLAEYTGVPPGRYRFRVAASTDGRTWTEASPTALRIRPHPWQTRWFAGLCVAAAVLLGYGLLAARRRRLEARFELVLRERARMAGEIHDTLL